MSVTFIQKMLTYCRNTSFTTKRIIDRISCYISICFILIPIAIIALVFIMIVLFGISDFFHTLIILCYIFLTWNSNTFVDRFKQFTTMKMSIEYLVKTIEYLVETIFYCTVPFGLCIVGSIFIIYYVWFSFLENYIEYLFDLKSPKFFWDFHQSDRETELAQKGFTVIYRSDIEYSGYNQCCLCNNSANLNHCLLTSCGHIFHINCVNYNHIHECQYCNTPFHNGEIFDLSPFINDHLSPFINHESNIEHHNITFSILKKNAHYDSDCCICYKTLKNRINVLTSCEHVFHNTCFKKWIEISQTCPMCRNDK